MDFRYLDEERQKLWHKVDEIEKLLMTKTSDSEVEARQNAEESAKHLQDIQPL